MSFDYNQVMLLKCHVLLFLLSMDLDLFIKAMILKRRMKIVNQILIVSHTFHLPLTNMINLEQSGH